jgi:hypothetical protein
MASFTTGVAAAATGVWWLVDGGRNDAAWNAVPWLFVGQLVLLSLTAFAAVKAIWA